MTCSDVHTTCSAGTARPAERSGAEQRGFFHGLVGAVVSLFDVLLIWQERAAQRSHLKGLDDHLLRDMGLTRDQVDCEAHKPFWQG